MRATGAGSKTPPWIKELRSLIKRQHGVGWGIGEQSGKCKLTRRYPDGGRSSVVLPLAWQSSSSTEILSQLQAIRSRMEKGGLSFNEAASLETKSDLVIKATMDWTLILEKFQKYKTSDTGAVKEETFLRMYRPNLLQLVSVVSCRPIPRDGKGALARLRDTFGGAPGSQGRRHRIQYAAQLLRFSVDQMGAPICWIPPRDLLPFIGRAGAPRSNAATPVKDEQLLALIKGLKSDSLRFAIELIATFGLRPVELRYIQCSGQKLKISYQKRNSAGLTKPRTIKGLDPEGLEGLAEELLDKLRRKHKLPSLGNREHATASFLEVLLSRQDAWKKLKSEAKESGAKFSLYSLRHGFALRAAQFYNLSPRVTAALMGHTLQTHVNHYGQWTDEEVIDQAVDRAIAQRSQVVHRAS
jgi:integrase